MIDKIKLVLSVLLFAAGVAGFYLLADKALVLRILVVIAGIVAAALVFKMTPVGETAFGLLMIQLLKLSVSFGQHVKKPYKQQWLYFSWS